MRPADASAGPREDGDPVTVASRVLARLAVPRLTGSAGWRETTAHVRDAFSALGYRVTDHEFEFSDWPARFGPFLVGLLISAGIATAYLAIRSGHAGAALIILLGLQLGAAVLIAASERFLLRFPRGRRRGINLMAQSGNARPRWLLVAHRDSKSQLVPIGFRIVAAAAAGIVWLLLGAGALLAFFGVTTPLTALPIAATGVVAGVVLMACLTANDSPGALDNASGVAALAGIAARERGAGDIAFLITDAEEFGLAGASALAGSLAWLEGLINTDGVDDHGPFRVLGRYGTPRRGGAPAIEAALRAQAAESGEDLRTAAVPRGLLLDHLAFARAGIPALTVMRGSWRSMARVHRPADAPDRLSGAGIRPTIDLMCGALRRMRMLAPDPERH